MHGNDPPSNRQSETSPTLRLGGRVVSLLELIKDFGLIAEVNARSGIAHGKRISPVTRDGFDRHLAGIGEFDGVAHDVEKNLGEPPLVAMGGRQVVWQLDL